MNSILERMKKSWKTLAWVLGALMLGSVLGVAAAGDVQTELDAANSSLKTARNEGLALKADQSKLEAELEAAQNDLEELQDEYEDVTANLNDLEAKAKTNKLDAELADARSLRKSLKEQEAAARKLKRQLDKELGVVRNSKVGDGVWQVGSEIPAGIYRSPAGSSCYWAILNSADTSNIANNGGFTANQTVTLTAGKWFESSGCGNWTKIG